MPDPFTRAEFESGESRLLHRGRSANAYLSRFTHQGIEWVVKDFRPCWLTIRWTWGAWMARREYEALAKLQGVDGFPQGIFQMDRFAICYHYIEGTTIREIDQEVLKGGYFAKLEALVERMHDHGIVHLDIRYRRNILITDELEPYLLDFQTSLCLDRMPRWMHAWLKTIDISGVYKQWHKRDPQTIDANRMAILDKGNRKRKFWILKGYAGIKRPPQ
jgi:RIO-like serine/threonine protein kinase